MRVACVDDARTYVEIVSNVLIAGGHEVLAGWGPGCERELAAWKPDVVVAVLARTSGALGDPIDDFASTVAGGDVLIAVAGTCVQLDVPLVIVGLGLSPGDLPIEIAFTGTVMPPEGLDALDGVIRDAVLQGARRSHELRRDDTRPVR